MPRKPKEWIETVEDFPTVKAEHPYRVRVVTVEKSHAPPGFSVTIEHLDAEQLGRRHTFVLQPIRPMGVTAMFFTACGFSIAPSAEIKPKDAIGRTIHIAFNVENNQPVAFTKENTSERNEPT